MHKILLLLLFTFTLKANDTGQWYTALCGQSALTAIFVSHFYSNSPETDCNTACKQIPRLNMQCFALLPEKIKNWKEFRNKLQDNTIEPVYISNEFIQWMTPPKIRKSNTQEKITSLESLTSSSIDSSNSHNEPNPLLDKIYEQFDTENPLGSLKLLLENINSETTQQQDLLDEIDGLLKQEELISTYNNPEKLGTLKLSLKKLKQLGQVESGS